jgi:hypothetical protein
MSNNRRQFLRFSGLALTGIAGGGLKGWAARPDPAAGIENGNAGEYRDPGIHRQLFNMTGYAAPKIETVRIGICLRNGLPMDYNVYDAALWSCVVPLSEWSVANQSKPVKIPDFTCGSWMKNVPIALSIDHGNLTEVK